MVARIYSQTSRNMTRLSDSGMRRLLRRSGFLFLPVVDLVSTSKGSMMDCAEALNVGPCHSEARGNAAG